jgi:hypothetical protein
MEIQIKSLRDLEIVKACKKSVYSRTCEFGHGTRPLPAAVVINFTGLNIAKLIDHGLWTWDSNLHKQPREPGQEG